MDLSNKVNDADKGKTGRLLVNGKKKESISADRLLLLDPALSGCML